MNSFMFFYGVIGYCFDSFTWCIDTGISSDDFVGDNGECVMQYMDLYYNNSIISLVLIEPIDLQCVTMESVQLLPNACMHAFLIS